MKNHLRQAEGMVYHFEVNLMGEKMTRATKKQLDEAKELILAGEWPSHVSKKTGVSSETCQAIFRSLKEPLVMSRPMNEEEIKKYGSPSKNHVRLLEEPENEEF